MLSPKRLKYRKYQKGKIGGIKSNRNFLHFGKYGIKAETSARISARMIEAVRRTMTRRFKRSGQIWIRIFPDIPVTAKPAEVRMGKGKGSPSYFICRVQSGQILFEMDGISPSLARLAAALADHKLNIKTKFVSAD